MQRRFAGVALIPSFIAMAARYGVSFDKLETAGVEPFANITLGGLDKLLCLFQKHAQNPAFFLELGEQLSFESLGIIGQVLATAQNTRQGIRQFNELRQMIHPFAYFAMSDTANSSTITYLGDTACLLSFERRYQEIFMAALLKISQAIHGEHFMPISVSFTFARPPYLQHFQRIFGHKIKFSQPTCNCELDTDLLDAPIRGASSFFNKNFVKRSQQLLRRLSANNNVRDAVLQVIASKIGHVVFNMQDVAAELNVPLRTLQRHLKKEGTSYAQLRDQVRFARAEEYLRDHNMDMPTIAASLGFSDTANFYSAFKRWQGCSALAYRRQFAAKSPS